MIAGAIEPAPTADAGYAVSKQYFTYLYALGASVFGLGLIRQAGTGLFWRLMSTASQEFNYFTTFKSTRQNLERSCRRILAQCQPVSQPALSGFHREGTEILAEFRFCARVFLQIFGNGQNRKIPFIHGLIKTALGQIILVQP